MANHHAFIRRPNASYSEALERFTETTLLNEECYSALLMTLCLLIQKSIYIYHLCMSICPDIVLTISRLQSAVSCEKTCSVNLFMVKTTRYESLMISEKTVSTREAVHG